MFLKIWLGCMVFFGLITSANYNSKNSYQGQLYLIKGISSVGTYGTNSYNFSINPIRKICTDKYHSNTFFRKSFYHLESYYEDEDIIKISCVHNRWVRNLENLFSGSESQKRYFRDILWWQPKFFNSTIFIDNNEFVGYICYPELNSCSQIKGGADKIKL